MSRSFFRWSVAPICFAVGLAIITPTITFAADPAGQSDSAPTRNAEYRVKFISQVVPTEMEGGKEYTLVVQYKNLGPGAWSASENIQLTLADSPDRQSWGTVRGTLDRDAAVRRDEVGTFRATVRAPRKGGTYTLQWQLRSGNSVVGEPTPKSKVTVLDAVSANVAEFVSQTVPGMKKAGEYFTVLERGTVYPITLTFKNNGSVAWTMNKVRLVSQSPTQNIIWAIDQVDLRPNETVDPGEMKSFTFKIITPSRPGIYPLQWQLMDDVGAAFGTPTDKIAVTVR